MSTPGDDRAAATEVPLIALLGRAHDALENLFNEQIRASEFDDLSLAHVRNVLLHLSEDPTRATSLACQCGVSKQALSLQINHLVEAGYLASCTDPSDARARLVTLTARGRSAQTFAHALLANLDADWRRTLSQSEYAMVRHQLSGLVDTAAVSRTHQEDPSLRSSATV